jgi:hypothetical protein
LIVNEEGTVEGKPAPYKQPLTSDRCQPHRPLKLSGKALLIKAPPYFLSVDFDVDSALGLLSFLPVSFPESLLPSDSDFAPGPPAAFLA